MVFLSAAARAVTGVEIGLKGGIMVIHSDQIDAFRPDITFIDLHSDSINTIPLHAPSMIDKYHITWFQQ
jgi:hypothetical protein